MEGFSHWVFSQATSSTRIRQTARQASPTPYEKLFIYIYKKKTYEKLISKKFGKTQSKLKNAMQGLLTSFLP